MGYIYRIWHKKSGKSYIGMSRHKPFGKKCRIKRHLSLHEKGCSAMNAAIKKYGRSAFDYEILHKDVPEETLSCLEKACIKSYNTLSPNGYNLTTGGEDGKLSEESIEKIRNKVSGKNHPMYGKSGRLSNTYGRKASEKERKMRSEMNKGQKNPMYGKQHTRESRIKTSNTLRKKNNPNQLWLFDE